MYFFYCIMNIFFQQLYQYITPVVKSVAIVLLEQDLTYSYVVAWLRKKASNLQIPASKAGDFTNLSIPQYNGGKFRGRTEDLWFTRPMLYQLS